MRKADGYAVRCHYCFRRYSPYKCWFRCMMHKPVREFRPTEFHNRKGYARFDWAVCGKCNSLCRFRDCPACKEEIPHHAGHFRDSTIAIAGSRGSGKTVYFLALLDYLQRNAAAAFPGLVPMFEDSRSDKMFRGLYSPLAERGVLPDATEFNLKDPEPAPINVRLYGTSQSVDQRIFVVLHDPPGEVFQSFRNAGFVRYLAAARNIILTVDLGQVQTYRSSPSMSPSMRDRLEAAQPDSVLNTLTSSVRDGLGLDDSKQISKCLCVMLTKADENLWREHPRIRPLPEPTHPDELVTFHDKKRKQLGRANRRIREILEKMELHSFLTMADTEFKRVFFFSSSGLKIDAAGRADSHGVGVADPLYAIYQS